MKVLADVVSIFSHVNYTRNKSHSYQLQDLNYMKSSSLTGSNRDFRNNYTDAPSKNWSAITGAAYNFGLGIHNLRLDYQYSHSYNDNENALYRLDQLAEHDSTQIDLLPSTREALLSVMDDANSYNYTRNDDSHRLAATFHFVPRFLGDGHINVDLPLSYRHKRLDYFRVTQQQMTQSNWFLNPSLSIEYAPKTKEKINWFSEETRRRPSSA